MAAPPKGKAPASDTIMTPGDMKPLLALSKREPVQAAIGVTADGDGVILLNKRLKPKKLLAMLKAEASKAKIQLQPSTLRFGKAEVDTDYDAGMVRFFINKEAPGNMRMKLLEVVKRVPYQKVEINVDPSFEEESEDDAEGQEAASAAAPAAASPGEAPPPAPPAPPVDPAALARELATLAQRIPAVPDTNAPLKALLLKLANDANGFIKAKDLAAATAAVAQLREGLDFVTAADPAALAREIAALAQRIPAVTDPTLKATLLKLATDANAHLKARDLPGATALIAQLREGLGSAGAGGAPISVDWDALRTAWQSASDTVDQQITQLQAALRQSGNDLLEEIAEFGLNGVTGNHKVRLMAAMRELGSGDAATRTKNGNAALGLVRDFRGYLDSDERILVCDENPFGVAVSLRTTLGGALTRIESALQNAG